jgi:hypothetical protein
VHDCFDVEHATVGIGQSLGPVRHSGPALVEHDYAGERSEPMKGMGHGIVFPGQLDMRDETRDHHKIEEPAAEYLVGDVDAVVSLGVVGFRHSFHMTI